MFKKLIGDKKFYTRIITLALPMILQNAITAFVGMLDNIMVGAVGTEQMTGVAVANQLFFIFNLCIFGVMSGTGLFGAQFSGNNDNRGVRYTFRFKLIFGVGITLFCIGLFLLLGGPLCKLYMTGESEDIDPVATLGYAKEYLNIMLFGLLPYTLTQCYASTQRETGIAMPSMVAGIAAVFVNLILNYILIFGKFGAPALGIAGAAIATIISRFVELGIVVCWTHLGTKQFPFIVGAYKSLHVPGKLVLEIVTNGLPLVINETVWAIGFALLSQCYSLRGLDVVAAYNISQTFVNVFAVAFRTVGNAIGIIIGQLLGAGQQETAHRRSYQCIAFAVFVGVLTAVVFAVCSPYIPAVYNTTDSVRSLATGLMLISALTFPIDAFVHSTYFILRSGGKIWVTILFDCGFLWGLSIPVALIFGHFTTVSILPIYTVIQLLNIFKCFYGAYLVKKGGWVRNIIEKTT